MLDSNSIISFGLVGVVSRAHSDRWHSQHCARHQKVFTTKSGKTCVCTTCSCQDTGDLFLVQKHTATWSIYFFHLFVCLTANQAGLSQEACWNKMFAGALFLILVQYVQQILFAQRGEMKPHILCVDFQL